MAPLSDLDSIIIVYSCFSFLLLPTSHQPLYLSLNIHILISLLSFINRHDKVCVRMYHTLCQFLMGFFFSSILCQMESHLAYVDEWLQYYFIHKVIDD